jgi:hypothetical protein
MVGNLPTSIRHHGIGRACRLIVAPALLGAICLVVIAASPRAASPAEADPDPTEDRFAFALYRPLSLKDFKASVRLKFVRGTIPTVGIAFRFSDAKNYYVVSANALEGRVDVWRVINGKTQRIDGTEAEVVFGHWHTLEIIAQADAFTVAFDNDWLFTVFDRTFNSDGRLGLWNEEDTVTRFAELNITALPASEKTLKRNRGIGP